MKNKFLIKIAIHKIKYFIIGIFILLVSIYFLFQGINTFFSLQRDINNEYMNTISVKQNEMEKLKKIEKRTGVVAVSPYNKMDVNVCYKNYSLQVEDVQIDSQLLKTKVLAGKLYRINSMGCMVSEQMLLKMLYAKQMEQNGKIPTVDLSNWIGTKIQVKDEESQQLYQYRICGITADKTPIIYTPAREHEMVTDATKKFTYAVLYKNHQQFIKNEEFIESCEVTVHGNDQSWQWNRVIKENKMKYQLGIGLSMFLFSCCMIVHTKNKQLKTEQTELSYRLLGVSKRQIRGIYTLIGASIILLVLFELLCLQLIRMYF